MSEWRGIENSYENLYGHMEGHEFRFIDALYKWAKAEGANTIWRAFNSDEKRRVARRLARVITQDPRWLSRALEREKINGTELPKEGKKP